MVNKEKCFQTTNELMLGIVLEEYKEDLVLSAQRLLLFKAEEDMETYALELPFYTKTTFKIKQIQQLIDEEKESFNSVEHMISVFRKSDNDSVDYVTPSVADRF